MPKPPEFADVAVVIPAYRAAATIGRALASVTAQTVKPRQVIVVDDGSPDGTADAARACAGTMAGIDLKVVGQENKGAGAARNRALAEAEATYVAFLDADDEWLPEKLERSLARFDGPDKTLVAHDVTFVENGAEWLQDCARHFLAAGDPYVALYRKGYVGTCTTVARRDAVLAAGGFDEGLATAQDFDLWLKLLADPGARFEVFAESLSRYHVGADSITRHTGRRLSCCLEVARRHAPSLRQHPGFPLASVWYRVLAVHNEAFQVYMTRKDVPGMARATLTAPLSLASLTVNYLWKTRSMVSMVLWLWVLGAFAAYLYQFRDLVGPILTTLGLTGE
jgi:glycosyltransferase involved in cell wall biosynthesis